LQVPSGEELAELLEPAWGVRRLEAFAAEERVVFAALSGVLQNLGNLVQPGQLAGADEAQRLILVVIRMQELGQFPISEANFLGLG
jgi:hypothetical protein